mgnify:CR=1 FL=1
MIIRLVCYDIKEDACRTKIFDKLEYYGFLPLQKSVFCGKLPSHQWENSAREIQKIIEKYGDPIKDKFLAVVISKNCAKTVFNLGRKTDIYTLLMEDNLVWI